MLTRVGTLSILGGRGSSAHGQINEIKMKMKMKMDEGARRRARAGEREAECALQPQVRPLIDPMLGPCGALVTRCSDRVARCIHASSSSPAPPPLPTEATETTPPLTNPEPVPSPTPKPSLSTAEAAALERIRQGQNQPVQARRTIRRRPIRELLASPAAARDAIILGEILGPPRGQQRSSGLPSLGKR